MHSRIITVLCSGVALGVYIPALILRHRLGCLGLDTEVALLEDLYDSPTLESLQRMRAAFQESFELAKIAQRMTHASRPRLSPESVDALFASWIEEDRSDFIVWSGFWMPIIERYRELRSPERVRVDICRIDSIVSPSFRGHTPRPADDREIWFWNWNEKRLDHEIPITDAPPVPFQERNERLVIHGGGWGLGEHREVAQSLEALGMNLDRVVYRAGDVEPNSATTRTFMVEPGWTPWARDRGREPEFPPFGQLSTDDGKGTRFVNRSECHELYLDIRHCQAIVSKPGGGTLMDSLSSATPVVFLKPYGEAEQRNADLWRRLGYGLTFEEWRSDGYDVGKLARMHANLVNRRRTTTDYPRRYAKRLEQRQRDRTGEDRAT